MLARRTASTALLCALACTAPRRHEPPAGYGAVATSPGADPGSGPAPALLSAHVTVADAAAEGGTAGLVLLFSVEVDPLGLDPEGFSVVLQNGKRVVPEIATLAPANEADENRTVRLVGALGGLKDNAAEHVTVVGALHGENGEALRGLGVEVIEFAEPDTVGLALSMEPGPGLCPGAAAAVRTYWTDELRGVTSDDLTRVKVAVVDGSEASPVAFDDHPEDGDDVGADNVLDLCLSGNSRPGIVKIEAGTFTDPAGHATAAVSVRIREQKNR